ncbi:MAG TPA: hypothetical protein VFB58_05095 [Chloroflexota bacterium]|nr:hypothetical protein [Chloroflexota bacterium]
MTRQGGIQTAHLRLESIEDNIVCLIGGQYRAVLEVGSLNFGLQGEAEQEVVVASFAAFLNGLTFPVQIVARVLPIDMERYLGDLQERARHLPDSLGDLARDYVTFLQRLARNRTLLERRFYLVIPAQVDPDASQHGWHWPLRRAHSTTSVDAIRRQLTFRCEEIERQLSRCGLTARRLGNRELVHLFYACWCPDLARVQRLQPDLGHSITPVIASSIRKQRNLP